MSGPGVILCNPKFPHNVGAAIRACSCFGVHRLVWTGNRVNPADYTRLPREERMKGYKDVVWTRTERPFDVFPSHIPVCVEISNGARDLPNFDHPENAVYVFGPEDGGVSQVIKRFCHHFVYVPSFHCLNLAAVLNVVLYDRWAKRAAVGLEKVCLTDLVKKSEGRGEIPVMGWDGK
jgi:tRNA(Leu) C34 or U34 (ribose-2'-O)-methylase TrmL